MARMRVMLVLLLAIAAGGALAYGTYTYVKNAPAAAASIPTRPVVVAALDLDVGAALRPEDVRIVQWPANAVPAGVFEAPDELIGRGLVMPVIQNEPILPMKLASKEAGSGLPVMIPEGQRAVSVRVNEVIGVAGYVLPGTRVDVVAVASATDNKGDTTSKVVLNNVQVLAAGTKMEQDGDQGKPMPVSVVTLLVDPEQAERLTLASTEGKIQLALRNPLDKGAPNTPGVRPASLLGSAPLTSKYAYASPNRARIARPAAIVADATPPPAPVQTVEIIRGDKRSEEVVR
jgi:pilus assembly protein CpaB